MCFMLITVRILDTLQKNKFLAGEVDNPIETKRLKD